MRKLNLIGFLVMFLLVATTSYAAVNFNNLESIYNSNAQWQGQWALKDSPTFKNLNVTDVLVVNGTIISGNLTINGSVDCTGISGSDYNLCNVTGSKYVIVNPSGNVLDVNETILNATYVNKNGDIINGNLIVTGNFSVLGDVVNLTVDNANVNGTILPGLDNLFDVGSAVLQWGTGFFGTDVIVNGQSVCLADGTNCQADIDTRWTTTAPYLYNDSTNIYYNETKLNQTIDSKKPIPIWANNSNEVFINPIFPQFVNITNLRIGQIINFTKDAGATIEMSGATLGLKQRTGGGTIQMQSDSIRWYDSTGTVQRSEWLNSANQLVWSTPGLPKGILALPDFRIGGTTPATLYANVTSKNVELGNNLFVYQNATINGTSLTVNGTEVCLADGTNCQSTPTGINETFANATYLRLDTANDPLTGDLDVGIGNNVIIQNGGTLFIPASGGPATPPLSIGSTTTGLYNKGGALAMTVSSQDAAVFSGGSGQGTLSVNSLAQNVWKYSAYNQGFTASMRGYVGYSTSTAVLGDIFNVRKDSSINMNEGSGNTTFHNGAFVLNNNLTIDNTSQITFRNSTDSVRGRIFWNETADVLTIKVN